MSTERFAKQNAKVGIPVSDARAAAGSGAAHSLYSIWHNVLYDRLLYKLLRRSVTPKAAKSKRRGDSFRKTSIFRRPVSYFKKESLCAKRHIAYITGYAAKRHMHVYIQSHKGG